MVTPPQNSIQQQKSNELNAGQKRNARRLIMLMDAGLALPSFENRPNVGPLIPYIDQLCEAYSDAGVIGFRKAIKALSIDQPILTELYKASRYRPMNITELLNMG